ncbi:MAG: hypothetical protein QOH61_2096, partial [Chloroflexota bacterium]|nr:hypothetical protein [Chloroflexota bacterium]
MLTTDTEPRPIFVGGAWVTSPERLEVSNPADEGTPAGVTYLATNEQYEAAVEAAVAAFETTRRSAAYERGNLLRAISEGVTAERA